MTIGFRSSRRWALALALLLPAGDAGRAATVQFCSVSTTSLSFGRYNATSNVSAQGKVQFTCTLAQPISIQLDRGGGPAGTMRGMRNATHVLSYQIYLDPANTIVFGDGTNGSQFYMNAAPPPNSPTVIGLFGFLPGGQTGLPAGTYRDNITVKIIY